MKGFTDLRARFPNSARMTRMSYIGGPPLPSQMPIVEGKAIQVSGVLSIADCAANARLMWKALGRTDYFPIDVTHVNTTATPNCLQEPLSKSLEGTKWQRHYECAVAA